MSAIFMNSKNSKTSDYHRLSLNITSKTVLKEKINILIYQILAFTVHGKKQKCHIRTIKSKYRIQHEMKNFNYLIDHILYQTFKFTLNIYLKSMGKRLLILQQKYT